MRRNLILILVLVSFNLFGQNTIRVKSETYGFWTLQNDTMQILKSDNVIGAAIYVPESATDSVTIEGCTFLIDGIQTNGIKIPPAENSLSIGLKFAVIDSLKISSPDVSWVVLLINRE